MDTYYGKPTLCKYFKAGSDKINDGEQFGRFSGKTPKQAATKAFTSIIKILSNKKIPCTGPIQFSLQECTKGSKHKIYFYVGERKKLETPTHIQIGGKTIIYNYSNKIKKVGNSPEQKYYSKYSSGPDHPSDHYDPNDVDSTSESDGSDYFDDPYHQDYIDSMSEPFGSDYLDNQYNPDDMDCVSEPDYDFDSCHFVK